jgi:Ni/Co efflux regulator RcnB
MKSFLISALAATTALSGMAVAAPAAAQTGYYGQERYRDSDRDGRPDVREWNRDRDRDGRPDQYDRRDNRRDGRYAQERRHRYYGSQYGYNGYQGRWREGARYSNYRDSRYYLQDYQAYGLPAPRHGYRYYRDNNGDVVMAAIASGIIGLIIGGALSDNDDGYRYDGYRDGYRYR